MRGYPPTGKHGLFIVWKPLFERGCFEGCWLTPLTGPAVLRCRRGQGRAFAANGNWTNDLKGIQIRYDALRSEVSRL